jgi:NTP pyrophosphatase (non-canonical NTP hydrolase)
MESFNDYQVQAHKNSLNTSIHGDKLLYAAVGIGDEAGEVLGKFKKLYRDKKGVIDQEFKDALAKELGDVLWYIAEISTLLDMPLSHIADQNLEKCKGRKERGTLHGSGDSR